jgi:hypothetical protein
MMSITFQKKEHYKGNGIMKMTTKDVSFLSAVSDSLKNNGFVIIHIDYIGGAGAQDYFLVKSDAEIKEVISKVNPRDLVSVFVDEAIPIKGLADNSSQEQALAMLSKLQTEDSDESIIAVRRETDHLQLTYKDDWQPLYSPSEITQWFTNNQSALILVFPPPWNNDKALKAVGK